MVPGVAVIARVQSNVADVKEYSLNGYSSSAISELPTQILTAITATGQSVVVD